jgi:hypothetical protein
LNGEEGEILTPALSFEERGNYRPRAAAEGGSFQPVDFDFLPDLLELRVAGHKFGVADFGQGRAKAAGAGHFARGLEDGGLMGQWQAGGDNLKWIMGAPWLTGPFLRASLFCIFHFSFCILHPALCIFLTAS